MTKELTEVATGTNAIANGILSREDIQSMPIGSRILFDDALHQRFGALANRMAQSELCPEHLKGNPDACFSVIRMALNWNMDWFQVAASTYSPVKGKIGIEGKLAVGAMLGSRKVRRIKYRHTGDWSKVNGKFKMVQVTWNGQPRMKNGQPVMKPQATYTLEDEQGLGIIATAIMHDGEEVSTPEILLTECHPRNSAQWHNSPRRQIMNVASRALAQICAADVMMGVHFDDGLGYDEPDPIAEPIDVTPPRVVEPEEIGMSGNGEVEPGTESGFADAEEYADATRQESKKRRKRISLIWRGKKIPRTKFVRDISYAIRQGMYDDDFAGEVRRACASAGPENEKDLLAEVEPLLKQLDPDGDGDDGDIDIDDEFEIEEEFVDPETGEVHARETLDLA